MESDDARHAEPVSEIAISAGDHDSNPDDSDHYDSDPDDPRARWRAMPPPMRPETWVADHDSEPLPESLLAAEAEREGRERRYVAEYGSGGGP